LVILDVNMPGCDGFEICRRLRATSTVPVIMLTARTDESDIVGALGLGADDYVTKPFGFRQLVARVKAVLRRSPALNAVAPTAASTITSGACSLDLELRQVVCDGRRARLTPTEAKILHYLMINEGRVIGPQAIVERVWGYTSGEGSPEMVKVHIHRLRDKIECDLACPHFIHTVPGVGYCFRSKD
jgi:DNA-binding response OmpR family regulator